MKLNEWEWMSIFNEIQRHQQQNGEIDNINLIVRKHEHPDDTINFGRGFEGYSYLTINFNNDEKYVYHGVIHQK